MCQRPPQAAAPQRSTWPHEPTPRPSEGSHHRSPGHLRDLSAPQRHVQQRHAHASRHGRTSGSQRGMPVLIGTRTQPMSASPCGRCHSAAASTRPGRRTQDAPGALARPTWLPETPPPGSRRGSPGAPDLHSHPCRLHCVLVMYYATTLTGEPLTTPHHQTNKSSDHL